MTVVALSRRHEPAALLVEVAHHLLPHWEVSVEVTPAGTLLCAGSDIHRADRWLAVGQPLDDPWGADPLARPLSDALEDVDRFGPGAIVLSPGPVLLLDTLTGHAHRSLSGLVGFGPHPDDLQLSSTLGQSSPPPRAQIIEDSSPAFSVEGLMAEIEAHTPTVGDPIDLGAFTAHPWPNPEAEPFLRDAVYGLGGGHAIFRPHDRSDILTDPHRYGRVRDLALPELQYRCRLLGRWLLAPMFERPVLDQVGFAVAETQ